jgi:Fe-S cluster assembly protein SufD
MAEVRAMKTAAEQALGAAYEAALPRLLGKGEVASLREDAFRRFDAVGLPHRRIEEWKYTDLRALMREAAALAKPPDAAAKQAARDSGKLLAGVETRRIVFVDGAFVPEMSDLTAEPGLSVGSLAEALAKDDALVARHLGKTFETDDAAVALNTALMGDGAVIRIAAETALTRPVQLVFTAGVMPSAAFIRSLVVLEQGARATLIESHEGVGSQVNAVLEVLVGDRAELDYIKTTQTHGIHIGSLLASVGADAIFNSFAFNADAHLMRNQMFVRFAGEGTRAGLRGVSLARAKDHVDTTLLIEHAKGHCESREQFRSVLDDEARGVFQGKIVVKPQAQKTDAKMMTRALLLSEDAEADNKPELEIFADDVVCGHGATTSAPSAELKFYLRARGIPEKEAEALLVQAFVGEAILEIAHGGIREALMIAALKWLGARG